MQDADYQVGDGGASPTGPLWFISRMQHRPASDFVSRWHYSNRMPTGKNTCFVLSGDGVPYAVIVYGIGVNPYQAQSLGLKEVTEIKRLCRTEPKQSYELSRFIRLTRRMMGSPALVAFADPAQGHEGIVYKAAGFYYRGTTNAEWHLVDDMGNIRHRRFAYRYAKRMGITMEKARQELGLRRFQTPPKHRWVLL